MAQKRRLKDRVLNARPDTVDFRDRLYVPSLVEVPPERPLSAYCEAGVPILDQGTEGACTGFGLAAVANYLLSTRRVAPDPNPVSPRMLYEMARRYDEWPGEGYDGSSARGAMKGWHKHGVCGDAAWPYRPGRRGGALTPERIRDAALRPLGAYFRVNHKDLVAMHSALTEAGILYGTASVHEGWDQAGTDGVIPFKSRMEGGHAFAIVAYDRHGFWIQNSWGTDWGAGGYARLSYDDWLQNGTDVWVARLGAPVEFRTADGVAAVHSDRNARSQSYSFQDLRPHLVMVGNNGVLAESGPFANTEREVRSILAEEFPRITRSWKTKRILLYAHGGLVGADAAIQRVADYRQPLLDAEVYPLAFVWKTDYWTTLTNILRDALSRRRPEGLLDVAKDFMLDRLDDALEPLARALTGKAQWDEMKENALLATVSRRGGARLVLDRLAEAAAAEPVEIHVAGHSAGGIFMAPVVQYLTGKGRISSGPMKGQRGLGLPVRTCTLWAPAAVTDLFKASYVPALETGALERLAVFVLSDPVEQADHCANIYHKSLLYLVSNAFEEKPRIPLFRDGRPLAGMEKFIRGDKDLRRLFDSKKADLVIAPNDQPAGSPLASKARQHGAFDDDPATVRATLARILRKDALAADIRFTPSASRARDARALLNAAATA